MATPIGAKLIEYVMDPSDLIDIVYDARPMMAVDEAISDTWVLTMSAEGAAVGLTISSGGAYAPAKVLADGGVRFWLSVSGIQQANNIFLNSGIDIPITLRWDTTNVPKRTFERTMVITVRQR